MTPNIQPATPIPYHQVVTPPLQPNITPTAPPHYDAAVREMTPPIRQEPQDINPPPG